MQKRNIIIIISILAFITIAGGISYSYFVYNKDVGDITLNTGEISISLSNVNGNQTLSNIVTVSDFNGQNSSNYFDFTVNSRVDTERIYYEVYLKPKSGNTLDTSYLKTYLTNQQNEEINGIVSYNSLSNSEVGNGKVIYKSIIEVNQNGTTKNEAKNFRLRLWLDENYTESISKTFNFDIYLYAKNVDENFSIPYSVSKIRSEIEAKESQGGTCSNIVYEEDGITYLSGSSDCIDMNYLWYSGKLWRITAIYPDGAMKLVTDNIITSISYNDSNNIDFYTNANTTSYMYQWLNEDFYDTLYNANQFIDTTKKWNASMVNDYYVGSKLETTNIVTANVGLLNSYEYYNSYRAIEDSYNYYYSYLNNGYNWWLLNKNDGTHIWYVPESGNALSNTPDSSLGVRPAINIKSGLEFTGEGTINNPYKLISDKKIGTANNLINTRISGEYIKLKNSNNEQVFRIIGVENGKTKIIAMDYADSKSNREFADGTTNGDGTVYGSGQTITSGKDTWYNYLTATYYPNLVTLYGSLFDSGTYYMGRIGNGESYKLGICSSATGLTKTCTKTSQTGTFSIGLPRYGEMFSTQQIANISNSASMWLISGYNIDSVLYVNRNCQVNYSGPVSMYAARPTLHLKSNVKIVSGTGLPNNPYVVGL